MFWKGSTVFFEFFNNWLLDRMCNLCDFCSFVDFIFRCDCTRKVEEETISKRVIQWGVYKRCTLRIFVFHSDPKIVNRKCF